MPLASLIQLRDILSDLYDSEADIRLICRDVGLDVRQLVLSGSADNAWNAVLDEAQKQYAVGHLYVYVRQRYPRNPKLRAALNTDSRQLEEAARAASIVEANLFDLLHELLLSGVLSADEIERCYRFAIGDALAKAPPIPGSLALAVINLWNLPDAHRGKCVASFAQRIANHVRAAQMQDSARLAEEIEHWMEQPDTRRVLGTQAGNTAAIRAGRLCLLVAIAPDLASFQGDRHLRFQVGLHPYREDQAGQEGRHQPRWELAEQAAATGTAFAVESLPALILEAIDDIGEHYGQEVSLIELFLPLELMDQGVEQWEVKRRMPEKLFSRGQIVVRSWDLATDDYFKAARKRRIDKWRSFNEWRQHRLAGETDEELVPCCWEHLHELKPNAVFDDYYNTHDLAHACVGMAFAPPVARSREAPPELLDALIEAGVPIMLWLRQGPAGGADSRVVLGELETLVRTAAQDDLPRAVHQRRVAAAGTHDWGYHLALYWENPEHSLPQGNSFV